LLAWNSVYYPPSCLIGTWNECVIAERRLRVLLEMVR
jgi:hypothetical protein